MWQVAIVLSLYTLTGLSHASNIDPRLNLWVQNPTVSLTCEDSCASVVSWTPTYVNGEADCTSFLRALQATASTFTSYAEIQILPNPPKRLLIPDSTVTVTESGSAAVINPKIKKRCAAGPTAPVPIASTGSTTSSSAPESSETSSGEASSSTPSSSEASSAETSSTETSSTETSSTETSSTETSSTETSSTETSSTETSSTETSSTETSNTESSSSTSSSISFDSTTTSTEISAVIPVYADQCTQTSDYISACSCIGVTSISSSVMVTTITTVTTTVSASNLGGTF
ncbi:hypothetical protein BX600DRAFT_436312 [Xylariales sp. PMI_506]|nr:hypothetical protein BX600DRAFT_436312 [Xylariales sp. PMI_506]